MRFKRLRYVLVRILFALMASIFVLATPAYFYYREKGIPIFSQSTIVSHSNLALVLCSSIKAVWPDSSCSFNNTSGVIEIQEISDLLKDAFGDYSRVELGDSSHFKSLNGIDRLVFYRVLGYSKNVYPILGGSELESVREVGVISINFSLTETSINISKVEVFFSEDMRREWKPAFPRQIPRDPGSTGATSFKDE